MGLQREGIARMARRRMQCRVAVSCVWLRALQQMVSPRILLGESDLCRLHSHQHSPQSRPRLQMRTTEHCWQSWKSCRWRWGSDLHASTQGGCLHESHSSNMALTLCCAIAPARSPRHLHDCVDVMELPVTVYRLLPAEDQATLCAAAMGRTAAHASSASIRVGV